MEPDISEKSKKTLTSCFMFMKQALSTKHLIELGEATKCHIPFFSVRTLGWPIVGTEHFKKNFMKQAWYETFAQTCMKKP